MEKKIFALLFLGMILLSVSSVSALELNPFAEKKIYESTLKEDMSDFLKEDFNSNYGVIRLSKTFFWIETDKVAEYSLTENTDQCLINCKSKGKAVLYTDGKLFDDKYFLNKKGIQVEIDSQYYIKEIETYYEDVPQYKEVCSMQKIISNDTLLRGDLIEENVCTQELTGYEKVEKTKEVWKEYNFEVLKAGEYEWEIRGSKAASQSVDFIPTAHGKSLNEWAWWNSDWSYKKEIKVLGGASSLNNFPIHIRVLKEDSMKNDFSDLRFLNESENQEFNYYIDFFNSTEASVWVKIPTLEIGNNTLFMYYGNSEATSTSSSSNTFSSYTDVYSLFNKNNLVGARTIATTGTLYSTPDAVFGNSTNTNGQNTKTNYYTFNSEFIDDSINPSGTINFWVKTTTTETWEIMAKGVQGQTTDYCLGIDSSGNIGDWCWGTMSSGIDVADGEWHMITWVWGASDRIYVDGIDKGAMRSPASSGSAITDYLFTGYHFRDFTTNSSIDMFSFVNSLRSSDWIFREYQNSNSSYTLIGTPQQNGGISINLLNPTNAFNSSSQTIFFNATITPIKANITNITWRANSQTNFQTLNTNESITLNWTKTFADGDYTWNITACWIGESETESCTESTTRTFEIDSVAPILTLNAPLTNFTTLTLPINVTLNFTASDTNLDSCWFSSSINSTNTTFTCNTTQTIAFNSSGAHSFTYYANDTFGGESTGTAPFNIYYVQPSATATNPITEGGFSTHTLWVNMTNIKDFPTTAWLYWNNTNYGVGTKTNVSDDSVRFDKTIIVPSLNTSSVNWTWFYNISGNPNVENWNVSGAQQYINLNITECGAGTYRILNYTLYDQKTKVISPGTNASIEVDLTLTSYANETENWQFHTTKTGSNNLLVCLPSGALNNTAYQLDSIAKYSYQDHVVQYHYIVNFNLNSTTIPQTIKLYNLATEESTSFLVNYQDENYLYVEDAIIDVWRRYVGDGVFLSVEHGKTDAQGQTRLHLVTEDIIYKFLVWIDGELVYTSPEYLALCQATPCQINLRKTIDESNGMSERDNILYEYSFNKTSRTATFDFTTKDGTETTINMTILSSNSYENETACSTTLTTSGGQISCIIPTAFTNTSYQTLIYKDGAFFGTSIDSLSPNSMELFGYTGIILTAIGYLFLALMGISSGIATIIFGIIGLVLMGILQVFETGSIFGLASAIIWLIVAGVIIIIKITKRRIQ